MTVKIELDPTAAAIEVANGGHFRDDQKTDYAYATTDSGLLRILVASKGQSDWRIMAEFSPSAWRMVAGKRFDGDSGLLKGITATPKSWHAVAGDY